MDTVFFEIRFIESLVKTISSLIPQVVLDK